MVVIKFSTSGVVFTANKKFLNIVAYPLKEVEGKPHTMFCEDSVIKRLVYKYFWMRLIKSQIFDGRL